MIKRTIRRLRAQKNKRSDSKKKYDAKKNGGSNKKKAGPSVPMFGSDELFPPLPGAELSGSNSGYDEEFNQYSSSDIMYIVKKQKNVSKPASMEPHTGVKNGVVTKVANTALVGKQRTESMESAIAHGRPVRSLSVNSVDYDSMMFGVTPNGSAASSYVSSSAASALAMERSGDFAPMDEYSTYGAAVDTTTTTPSPKVEKKKTTGTKKKKASNKAASAVVDSVVNTAASRGYAAALRKPASVTASTTAKKTVVSTPKVAAGGEKKKGSSKKSKKKNNKKTSSPAKTKGPTTPVPVSKKPTPTSTLPRAKRGWEKPGVAVVAAPAATSKPNASSSKAKTSSDDGWRKSSKKSVEKKPASSAAATTSVPATTGGAWGASKKTFVDVVSKK